MITAPVFLRASHNGFWAAQDWQRAHITVLVQVWPKPHSPHSAAKISLAYHEDKVTPSGLIWKITAKLKNSRRQKEKKDYTGLPSRIKTLCARPKVSARELSKTGLVRMPLAR